MSEITNSVTNGQSLPQRKIEAHTVMSQILGEERTIKVFLPPNYDANRKYPIMYCHDGLEFFTHGRVATIANQMMLDGEINPMLIAGIAVSKTRRTDDYSMSGSRHAEYCQFVVEECLPMLDQLYSVDTNNRLMAGISLGGTVTMSLSLKHPDLFNQLLLFSGAFFESVQQRVKQEGSLNHLTAYMVVGHQETEVETSNGSKHDFYMYNQQMRDILRIRGAEVDYNEADGTHIWGFWQRLLPDALRFASAVVRTHPKV